MLQPEQVKSKIVEVEAEIAETKAKIEKAEDVGDREMVLALQNNLAELRHEKNLLMSAKPASGAGSIDTFQEIEGNMKKAVASMEKVERLVAPMGKLVPIVCNLMIDANNLWTKTQIADSVTGRSEEFRRNLVEHLGYAVGKGKKRMRYTCMVTGLSTHSDYIEAAHIAPARSTVKRLAYIGMTASDVNDVRNGLLLATEIHHAFDYLQLSFVKSNPLSEQLYVKIWDKSCLNIEVFVGAGMTIGQYDGAKLKLGAHEPFRRALSYHAYIAYLKFSYVPANLEPAEYGSENESEYYSERRLMKDAVLQDIKKELEGMDEGEDSSSA